MILERIGYSPVAAEVFLGQSEGYVLDNGRACTPFGTAVTAYDAVRVGDSAVEAPAEEAVLRSPAPPMDPEPRSGASLPPDPQLQTEELIVPNAQPYPCCTTCLGAGTTSPGCCEHIVENFHGLFLQDDGTPTPPLQESPDFAVVTAMASSEDPGRGRSRRFRRYTGLWDYKRTMEELVKLLEEHEGEASPGTPSPDDESWHTTFRIQAGNRLLRLPPGVTRLLSRSLSASSMTALPMLTSVAVKLLQRRASDTGGSGVRRSGRPERRKDGSRSPRTTLLQP